MRIEDVEIVNTLNEIQKVNDMIVFHQSFGETSGIAIENYQTIRQDLLDQLNVLLRTYNLTFSMGLSIAA